MMQGQYVCSENGIFAIYNCRSGEFWYSDSFKKIFPEVSDVTSSGNALTECKALTKQDRERLSGILQRMSVAKEPLIRDMELTIRDGQGKNADYRVVLVCTEPGNKIGIIFYDTAGKESAYRDAEGMADGLTGLMGRKLFLQKLEKVLREGSCDYGECAVIYFDVQRFKIINDVFGISEGDRLLRHIACKVRSLVDGRGFACHVVADRFALYIRCGKEEVEKAVDCLFDEIAEYELPFEILCNAGIYLIDNGDSDANAVFDSVILAQSVVKGSYTRRFFYYSEELRKNLFGEQEITGMMNTALKEGHFAVYYQPQYNHFTSMLVGAEALVCWIHPEKRVISPARFIPVFEKNGFITQMDAYVFERVCIFLKECMEKDIPLIPVSVNLTRYDIFSPGFIENMERIRKKYNVPVKYIRVEITESSAVGGSQFINEALRKFHEYGYIVEMDDFGSGYSSLNILKDIDFDMIKLDMNFLRGDKERNGRGGTILSSMVRMMNWLQLPVIAEGVETAEQADFLQSIGCDYIQGYLYSKPLPEKEFEELLKGSHIGTMNPGMSIIETLDANKFWSDESLEALIFSNYVGGAAIYDYRDGKVEILRVNKKYVQELGMNLTEKDIVNGNPLDYMDESDQKVFLAMLQEAIDTGEEKESETWCTVVSLCCGEERMCLRTTVRKIGESKGNYIFYVMLRNVTAEKKYYSAILDSERRFKMASEQVNIYYWEYTVATREMRPCFRCMRDLGLPALLTNYPDSAIEMGVFPPEVADMYRDWHRQIADGVPSLEAVIPLTADRIPFRVRYTTEFDENGHAVKAYGSAALVV